jgi:hypothetical protein
MLRINRSILRSFLSRNRSREFPLALIVGAQRSGTTWLQLLCAAHPKLAGGEESHLFSHYLGNLSNQYYVDLYSQEKLPRPQGLPCYLTIDEWTNLMRRTATEVLSRILIAKPQARLVIEKTPDHVLHLHFVRQLFPNCRIIHIVRDGRDVVVSQMEAARQKWGQSWAASDAREAATRWCDWVERARKYRQPRELYHEVRYEDLVSDGRRTLSGVFAFLGVPLSASEVESIYARFSIAACRDESAPDVLLRPGEVASLPTKRTGEGFFRAGVAGGWRTALADDDRVAVESIAGELLRELGYAVDPAKQVPASHPA